MRSAVSLLAFVAAGLLLTACNDDGTSPPELAEVDAASVFVTGFFQDTPAGTLLPEPLTVTAWDSARVPIAGLRVTWTVESDGGGTLSEVQQVTGSDGTARARWTIGTAPGRYLVHATVGGQTEEFIGISTGPPARVGLSYPSAISAPGFGFWLGATAYDARDAHISNTHATFSSSDSSVVSIDSLGYVLSRNPGSAVLTARVGAATGSVTLYVTVPLHATAVSVGGSQGCALTGDGLAYCWGDQGAAAPLAGGQRFTSLSEGGNVACGLDAAGTAYCWGSNQHGQLGSGGGPSSQVPVRVAGGLRFATLSAGTEHVCGVATSGAAYCWGSGAGGRLGTGSTADASAPAPVAGGITFHEVSASLGFTCGLTPAGDAYCWGKLRTAEPGDGGSSAPGAGVRDSSLVPAAVAGGQSFASMSTGDFTACGVTAPGTLQCWGVTAFSWYGGHLASSLTPQPLVPGTSFQSVQAGSNHLCGTTAGGVLLCWGDNYYGQLGDSTRTTTNVPVRAGGERSFTSVSTGRATTCAIDGEGLVYCWGSPPLGSPIEITLCTDGRDLPLVNCRIRPLPVLIDPTPPSSPAASRRRSTAVRQS